MNELIQEIIVPPDHPSLVGHFPGRPVVPAVVLLDAVLATIETRGAIVQSIPAAKFLHPVLPGEAVELRLRFTAMESPRWRASFQGLRNESVVFEGSFIVAMTAPAS